jgi:hypothetical protein
MASFQMNLEAGRQIMRLNFIEKPLFYIDFIDFKRVIPDGLLTLSDNGFSVYQHDQELIFNLKSDHSGETLRIYNILGSVVKSMKTSDTDFRISTQGMHPGVYIVQLISENQKHSQKIVIQ